MSNWYHCIKCGKTGDTPAKQQFMPWVIGGVVLGMFTRDGHGFLWCTVAGAVVGFMAWFLVGEEAGMGVDSIAECEACQKGVNKP